ncbi:hypothetical protein IGH99_19715 [Bacillus aryabhattai]|nr:hypothetical protein [Priestia aryabhattai]
MIYAFTSVSLFFRITKLFVYIYMHLQTLLKKTKQYAGGWYMFSLRGDAHKVYLKLKKAAHQNQNAEEIDELAEMEEIRQLYLTLDSATLRKVYYRMTKEKNGSGVIPILVSALPWLFFLFSQRLQQFLFKDGSWLWIIFVLLYVFILIPSVFLHFREQSWASVHIEIIQDILKDREKEPKPL